MMKNSIKPLLLLLLAGIVLSCGRDDRAAVEVPDHILEMDRVSVYTDEDIAGADTVRMIREQVFGDTDEELTGTPGSIAVDGSGTVYIGDRQQNTVHIFQQYGSYMASIGREGDGPGEFRWVGAMHIHSNELFVHDPSGRRINVYVLSPNPRSVPGFSHSISLTGENWDGVPQQDYLLPGLHSVRSDGSLLLSSNASPLMYQQDPEFRGTVRYYLADSNGENLSGPLFEMDMPEHIVTEWFTIPPPFAGRGLMALSPDDQIFSAWTEEFLIKIHDSDGAYQRAIYYPFKNRRLTRDEAINSVDDHEQLHNAVRAMQLPETWPALVRMFIDNESRIWISTIAEDLHIHEWWVLEETGELITRFEWPRDEPIEVVKNGYMYTRQTDDETGLQQIVRYRIELEEV